MASPTVAPSPKTFSFDSIAKSCTFALPLVYVIGFTLVTIHQASFGVTEFGFGRVKILGAGLLFTVVFLGIPALVGIRSYRLLGMRSPRGTRVDLKDDSQKKYLYLIKVADSYPLAGFMSLVFGFFFASPLAFWMTTSPTYQQPGRWLDFAIGIENASIMVLTFFPIPYIAREIKNKPKRCTIFSWLLWLLWIIWSFRMSNWLAFQLSLWIYIIMLGSVGAVTLLNKGFGFTKFDWEGSLLSAMVLLLSWFGNGIYGHLKPAFGGGQPIAAKFYLQAENPVWSKKVINTSIIDETSDGYYVMRAADKKAAVFIPRSSVISVQLGGD